MTCGIAAQGYESGAGTLAEGGGGLERVLPAQITSDRAAGHVPDQETWP